MEDRFDTDIDDVWSAITDPPVSPVESVRSKATSFGGEFDRRFFLSGSEGTGRVEAAAPPAAAGED